MPCDAAAVRVLAIMSACALAQPVQAQQVAASATPAGTASVYDALLDGMTCRQQKSGRMDCEFRAGGARFVISGVGQADATILFTQADSANELVAGVVPLHGCVVVKPTRPDEAARIARIPLADSVTLFAFVSPRTGRVYRKWGSCLTATRDRAVAGAGDSAESAAPVVARRDSIRRADSVRAAASRASAKKPQ